jgi:hypothetical protein
MKFTKARINVFLITFLIGVVFVYLIDGKVVPIWEELFAEEHYDHCWH